MSTTSASHRRAPCENAEWLVAQTAADDPGGLELNRPILDAVMASLQFID